MAKHADFLLGGCREWRGGEEAACDLSGVRLASASEIGRKYHHSPNQVKAPTLSTNAQLSALASFFVRRAYRVPRRRVLKQNWSFLL